MVNKSDLYQDILKLKKDKNAVIFAHYYQNSDIQDIADYIGDSLILAQKAQEVEADIIVLAGVHFMAETAKILNPKTKVIIPVKDAGCSLADSCQVEDFKKFKSNYPGYTSICYVNTSAAVKCETDIVCTSSNALAIVNSLPKDEKIIFAPDRNLGNYIKTKTGRDMIIWDGACHVHEDFSLSKLLELKKEHPNAQIIAHPECKKDILSISDFIGSTKALLDYVNKDSCKEFIVVTEPGVIFQMQKLCSDKTFIAAPPKSYNSQYNFCKYMRLITLEDIKKSLEDENYQVILDEKVMKMAVKPINRMLDISKQIGLIK